MTGTTILIPPRLKPPQRAIYRATSRYLVLVAGRRFGKTVLSVKWLIREVLKRGPDALGYYVAPYRVMAKAIAWEMLLKFTRDIRTARNETELSVTLLDGSRISLRGADDPETLEGVGLSAVVCDEFARMKLDAWQKSLRPALSDKGGRALFCGKPRGFNHLKDFYERGQDRARFPEWESWLFSTLDGGHVPAADVAEARTTLPAKAYRQEYEASFENAAGRVYEDFTRRTHVVPHAELERAYKPGDRWQFRAVCVGVDWGYVDPGVALVVGQTGAGDLVVVDEVYKSGQLVDDAGWLKTFRALRAAHPGARWVADPSEPGFIAAARGAVGKTVEGAQNDWREGHRRVATALLPKAHSKGRPGLIVSDRCAHLIREFEQHVFREVRGVQVEEPESGNDHALDALRYATMALTQGPGVKIF